MKLNRLNIYFFTLLFCLMACGSDQEPAPQPIKPVEKPKPVFSAPDGPYLFHQADGSVRMIGADEEGYAIDTVFAAWPKDYIMQVVSHNKKHRFTVRLQPFERQPWKQEAPEKLLVISDPHANWDCFLSVLQANGVVDDNYAWKYGKNGLMIIGDIFDRGDDAVTIFWLTYKLQQEARAAGGAVHFIIGNHESMILRNDLRYMTEKYTQIAAHFEMDYAKFFGADTELGRWIAAGNTMQIIGDDLFVHAGLGEAFYKGDYKIPYVNEQISQGIFLDKDGRNKLSEHSEFLFSSSSSREGGPGPIWYRGMVGRDGEEPELDEAILDALLERYGVKRIIVGHTIFPEVSFFYDGKVVAVNVDNKKNYDRLGSRGILIEGGKTRIINDKGE